MSEFKVWKKIIVSGSDAHLNTVSASSIHLFNEDGTGGTFTSQSLASAIAGGGGDGTTIALGEYSTAPDAFPGFFEAFQTTTTITNALEQISTVFIDIAPSQPGVLDNSSLTKFNPTNQDTFTARLAGGLESTHWGLTEHNEHTFVKTTDVRFRSPSVNNKFRAGAKSNFQPTNQLIGGVSASKKFRDGTMEVFSKRALSAGTNNSGEGIRITSLEVYNEIWVKANAEIHDTLSGTGSYVYKMSADNGAGETNEFTLSYVGNNTHFPHPSISDEGTSITVGNEQNSYLSGIAYYDQGTTFTTTGVTVNNLFNPVYKTNHGQFASSYTNTALQNVPTNINANPPTGPNHNDTYGPRSFTITVENNKTSNGTTAQTGTLTFSKPGRTAATVTKTLGNKGINSKSTPSNANNQSPNIFNVEDFFTETHRKNNETGTGTWDSTATLTNNNLAVVNGKLFHGNKIGSGFSSFNQHYFRIFTPTQPVIGGQIGWTGTSQLEDLSPAGSQGILEMVLFIQNDTSGNIYDLGRSIGDNSGDFIGIKDSNVGSDDEDGIIFGFPAGVATTPANAVVLRITYNISNSATQTSENISQLNLKFT